MLQAVEKAFEFRFLANFAVRLYRLFAKNEKRQTCHKFDTCGKFKTPPSTLCVAISPCFKWRHNSVEYIGVFQELYRQSKCII